MKQINGGVCAAKGFVANGIHCGIRKNKTKRDLALIFSTTPAAAAAVYTQNLVKGAPLTVTKDHISDGVAQAMICNSGNANTCNANGIEIAEQMSDLLAKELKISPKDVIVASTGVIGQPLDITPIANGIPALVEGLGDHSQYACEGIMTTDTKPKEISFEFEIGGDSCRIGGIAKGSGMIHPNMATMLVFVTTDCAITSEMLAKALKVKIELVRILECVPLLHSHILRIVLAAERLDAITFHERLVVIKVIPCTIVDVCICLCISFREGIDCCFVTESLLPEEAVHDVGSLAEKTYDLLVILRKRIVKR